MPIVGKGSGNLPLSIIDITMRIRVMNNPAPAHERGDPRALREGVPSSPLPCLSRPRAFWRGGEMGRQRPLFPPPAGEFPPNAFSPENAFLRAQSQQGEA